MKICMIGTGYVGLVTGTCFAESGNEVTCIDIDAKKVAALNRGEIPIYEPGLEELVKRNSQAGRLKFTTDYADSIPGSTCVFIAVGTPQSDEGAADLTGLWKVVDTLAPLLSPETVVVIKSTVPPGTNRKTKDRLRELCGRDVDVASNPEFLKEGAAIDDFTKPDRVVVGVTRPEVADTLNELYKPFLRTERPFLRMGLESAEMTKYVANCMLATKISFINEMANLCELLRADVNEVRRGIGHDQRIGFSFLFPGAGYGGSCFPKDVRALISAANAVGLDAQILKSVDEVNNAQKSVLFQKLHKHFGGNLRGKTVAIWGLSFKPQTDDFREAPASVLIPSLLEAGAKVRAHDPKAIENAKRDLAKADATNPGQLSFHNNQYEALDGADVLAIVTEWNEYRNPDFAKIKQKLKQQVVFDGRNLYDVQKMQKAGFTYSGIGLNTST